MKATLLKRSVRKRWRQARNAVFLRSSVTSGLSQVSLAAVGADLITLPTPPTPPRQAMIMANLRSSWARTPVDLHLSKAPDKAAPSPVALLRQPRGERRRLPLLSSPFLQLLLFLSSPPLARLTVPTRGSATSDSLFCNVRRHLADPRAESEASCLGRKEVMRQVLL